MHRSLYNLTSALLGMLFSSQVFAQSSSGEVTVAKPDQYMVIASKLAESVKNGPVNVGIGSFYYGTNVQGSAYSALLRKELEIAVNKTDKFELVARSNLAELYEAGDFNRDICDPGSGVKDVKIKGIDAIIRGNFFYKFPAVTVYAELAWLADGKIDTAKVEIPVSQINAQIWPDQPVVANKNEAKLSEYIKPQNLSESQANIADVESRIKKVPHDFNISLMILEGKREFSEGESISYRIKADKDCHIGVFCHQVDGSTALLFPNSINNDTRILKDTKTDIPGTRKSGFEIIISPPFGADVVQVIACTEYSHLHKVLQKHVKDGGDTAYRGVSRGMIATALAGSLPAASIVGPALWAEAHIVVSTYPKY